MDLRERLKTYGAGNAYPFHMPGHKRQKQPGSLFPYDLDITEIDGFDNLHHAEGILAGSQTLGQQKKFFSGKWQQCWTFGRHSGFNKAR